MGTAFTGSCIRCSAFYYNPQALRFSRAPIFRWTVLRCGVVSVRAFLPAARDRGASEGIQRIHPTALHPGREPLHDEGDVAETDAGFRRVHSVGLAANFTNFRDSDPALTKYTGRWAGTRAKLESFWSSRRIVSADSQQQRRPRELPSCTLTCS